MRLFIAADLPESAMEALRDNLADLARAGFPRRLTAPSALHMTLAFLGERGESERKRIVSAMGKTADEITAFEISLGDYGTFGSDAHGVLWQGLSDGTEMTELADCLGAHLEAALRGDDGSSTWVRAPKQFTPHVTLARKVNPSTLDLGALEEPWVDSGDVASITLWRSHLSSEGPTYEALRTVALSSSPRPLQASS